MYSLAYRRRLAHKPRRVAALVAEWRRTIKIVAALFVVLVSERDAFGTPLGRFQLRMSSVIGTDLEDDDVVADSFEKDSPEEGGLVENSLEGQGLADAGLADAGLVEN